MKKEEEYTLTTHEQMVKMMKQATKNFVKPKKLILKGVLYNEHTRTNRKT